MRTAGILDHDHGAITAEHLQTFALGGSVRSPVDFIDLYYLLIVFFDWLVGFKVKRFWLFWQLADVD